MAVGFELIKQGAPRDEEVVGDVVDPLSGGGGRSRGKSGRKSGPGRDMLMRRAFEGGSFNTFTVF